MSVFVAVGTEFGRTLLSAALGRFHWHLLTIETVGAQHFPLVAPVRRHRAFDAHGADVASMASAECRSEGSFDRPRRRRVNNRSKDLGPRNREEELVLPERCGVRMNIFGG